MSEDSSQSSARTSSRLRSWLWAGVRVLVCVIALAWVVHNVTFYDYVTLKDGSRLQLLGQGNETITVVAKDGGQREISIDDVAREGDNLAIQYGLHTTWNNADKSRLLLTLLLFSPVTFLQSLRFRWMLRAQEIDVSYWESVKLCFAGNFLNFLTALGTTGGDVFKMYYVSLHTDRKTEAVVTVVLDRIVGLYGLVVLVAVVLAVRSGDTKLTELSYGMGVIAGGSTIAALLLFSDRVRALVRADHLLAKLPFASHLQRAEAATRRLARHKKLVLGSLLATVMLQVVALSSYTCAAWALGMDMSGTRIWDYYAYLAGGVVIAAIPISFQGLGTMEAFYKYVFIGTHGSLAAILCLAMAIRLVGLLWSLPGLLVTMTGAYRPKLQTEQIQLV